MVELRSRFPSRQDTLPVFAVIALVVYSWTLYRLAYFIPGWLNAMSPGEIFVVVCYGLAFDLFESLVILMVLLILAFILPRKLFQKEFTAQASLIVLVLTVAAIYLQDNIQLLYEWQSDQFRTALLAAGGSFVIVFILVLVSVKYIKVLVRLIRSVAERAIVFLYMYIPLSILSLIVIIILNLIP